MGVALAPSGKPGGQERESPPVSRPPDGPRRPPCHRSAAPTRSWETLVGGGRGPVRCPRGRGHQRREPSAETRSAVFAKRGVAQGGRRAKHVPDRAALPLDPVGPRPPPRDELLERVVGRGRGR